MVKNTDIFVISRANESLTINTIIIAPHVDERHARLISDHQ